MYSELFTIDGKRKYLNADELDRFIQVNHQERPEVRPADNFPAREVGIPADIASKAG